MPTLQWMRRACMHVRTAGGALGARSRSKFLSIVIVTAAASALVAGQGVAAVAAVSAGVTSSQAKALSTNVTQKVVVVLKDQIPQDPASPRSVHARRQVEAREQQPIMSELSDTKARNVHSYTTINAV